MQCAARFVWFAAVLTLIPCFAHAEVALPTLGTYANAPLAVGANITVTPNAVPTGTTGINVSTNTNFKGTLTASPVTGLVRITNAHPAGVYVVTVLAFGPGGTSSKTFTLTVNTGTVCNNNVVFSAAPDVTTGFTPNLSVVVGDFNNDGNQDLAAAGSPPVAAAIRLGDGLGGFSGTSSVGVSTTPFGMVTADFNNDGNLDLAATSLTNDLVAIRLGDGLGGFSGTTTVAVGDSPLGLAVGDFNKDGKVDLAVANSNAPSVSIRLGDGLGGFSGTTDVSTNGDSSRVAIGDFNQDGNPDFASTNTAVDTVSIRLGDGTGGFSGTTNLSLGDSPQDLAIGDFNNDGKQDLAISRGTISQTSFVSVRLGDGLGAFSGTTEANADNNPSAIATADFNNDGNQDFATANTTSSVVIFNLLNSLGGVLAVGGSQVGTSPRDIAIGDFNEDGKPDYVTGANSLTFLSIGLGGCGAPELIFRDGFE